MNLYIKSTIVLLFSVFLFSSCNDKEKNKGRIIAKVYDEYLYESDIRSILPEVYTSSDSADIVDSYIKQWVNDAVILIKAKKNIDSIDFEKKLNDYKNSLIIYEYERQLVNQLLDTAISYKEIVNYYNTYPDNFRLKDNILKVVYVKLEKDSKVVDRVKKLVLKSEITDENIVEIENIASYSAVDYFIDKDKWIIFSELQRVIPIETYNEKLFLQNNKNITIEDREYIYIARIIDFKIKESISPLNFEKERIKTILLNKKKVEIINNMHTQLQKEAELNNEIVIYEQNQQ